MYFQITFNKTITYVLFLSLFWCTVSCFCVSHNKRTAPQQTIPSCYCLESCCFLVKSRRWSAQKRVTRSPPGPQNYAALTRDILLLHGSTKITTETTLHELKNLIYFLTEKYWKNGLFLFIAGFNADDLCMSLLVHSNKLVYLYYE